MRTLRNGLRVVFALESIGCFSAALFSLRLWHKYGKKLATAFARQHRHLGPHALVYFSLALVLLSGFAGLAAWRMSRRDALGRWSLLAASIMNVIFYPAGLAIAAAGIFYFVRNPAIDLRPERKHKPIAGDGTSKLSGIIFTGGQIVWGVFILSSIGRWTASRGMPQIHSEGLFWITFGCAVYGTTLIHELGHFVLGDIVRFRLVGFGVGPASWTYAYGRWQRRVRYNQLFGGHTAMVPRTSRHLRERAMILTAGGPLASLLIAIIGGISLLLIPGPIWPAAIGRTVALATAFGLGDFLFNLLPMASQAQYSDGARIWQLYHRGPWCDFLCANYYMGLSRASAMRPRDWPRDLVLHAAEFGAQLPEPAGSFTMAYTHFLDCGEWGTALTWLDKAREVVHPGSKLANALTIDRAFVEAFHMQDGAEAQRLFEQAPPRKDSTDYWRALASVQAAHGDLAAASATLAKAWEIAKIRPNTGIYDMDREQLRMVGAWIEELRAQPVLA